MKNESREQSSGGPEALGPIAIQLPKRRMTHEEKTIRSVLPLLRLSHRRTIEGGLTNAGTRDGQLRSREALDAGV
jgi:hypothetical protein